MRASPRPPCPRPHPTLQSGLTTPSHALGPSRSSPPRNKLCLHPAFPSGQVQSPSRTRTPPGLARPASRPSTPSRRPSSHKLRPCCAAALSSGKGMCQVPTAEVAVHRCRHSRPSARVPASPPPPSPPPPPPPPAGLERPASASLPAPSFHCTRKPALHGHARNSCSNQLAEAETVTGCRFD